MRQSGWLPLLLGLGLGLGAGLVYSWVVNPVEYVDTAPGSMRDDFQSDYLALIAAAYSGSRDLGRARARLALFEGLNPAAELAALAQRRQASGHPPSEAAALAELAAALQGAPTTGPTTPTPAASATPALPSPTPTATRTRVPSPTPGAPFELVERQRVCDPLLPGPLIQVEVSDVSGTPVAGVEVLVVWDEGEDRFFTGLKPELGLGYADFSMTEGVSYALQLSASGQPVSDLSAFECTDEEDETYLGSWLLSFQQPES